MNWRLFLRRATASAFCAFQVFAIADYLREGVYGLRLWIAVVGAILWVSLFFDPPLFTRLFLWANRGPEIDDGRSEAFQPRSHIRYWLLQLHLRFSKKLRAATEDVYRRAKESLEATGGTLHHVEPLSFSGVLFLVVWTAKGFDTPSSSLVDIRKDSLAVQVTDNPCIREISDASVDKPVHTLTSLSYALSNDLVNNPRVLAWQRRFARRAGVLGEENE